MPDTVLLLFSTPDDTDHAFARSGDDVKEVSPALRELSHQRITVLYS